MPSGSVTCTESGLPGLDQLPRVGILLPGEQLLGRGPEAHVHRIEHVDRGEQVGGPVTRAPPRRLVAADPPADLRAHDGVVEILLRLGQVALGARSISARALSTSCCATAFCVSSGSRRSSVRLALSERAQRAPVRGLGPHPVEPVEHLSRLHDGAFGEGTRLDDAVDPRAHLDAAVRLHLAGELVGGRHPPRLDLHHARPRAAAAPAAGRVLLAGAGQPSAAAAAIASARGALSRLPHSALLVWSARGTSTSTNRSTISRTACHIASRSGIRAS